MTFAQSILAFFDQLNDFPGVPPGVEVLNPYQNQAVKEVTRIFYEKYYNDTGKRRLIIGINPGRFGAGLTGIPFTDPIRLKTVCQIENAFDPKPELSSKFIYELIAAMGGTDSFYSRYYFSSVSPLGFTKDGKNLNYYDIRALQEGWEEFMINNLKKQLAFGCSNEKAFVLGRGKNFKYMQGLNERTGLFDTLVELPHPRWVMQYRLKRMEEFLQEYIEKLTE